MTHAPGPPTPTPTPQDLEDDIDEEGPERAAPGAGGDRAAAVAAAAEQQCRPRDAGCFDDDMSWALGALRGVGHLCWFTHS
jgi:hypothetical protein